MERPKPLIERNERVRIVTLKVLMMKIVCVTMSINGCFLTNDDFVVSRVSLGRPKRLKDKLADYVQRIRWNDQKIRTPEK